MATHISVLPLDVLDTLTQQLNTGPTNTGSGLTFLRLPHPRTGIPSLFLPSRKSGQEQGTETILEVQTIAPNAARSWFLGENEVVADGKLVLMTPVDPAFLLIPIVEAMLAADGSLGNFRTADDLFDTALLKLADLKLASTESKEDTMPILSSDLTKLIEMKCTQAAMRRICEYKDVTEGLTVYRYTRQKATEYMVKKAQRLSKAGTVDSSRTMTRELAKDGLMEDGKEPILEAGRLKLACDLVSQYLPTHLHRELLSKFDFTELDAHVRALQESSMTSAVQASASSTSKGSETAQADNNDKDGKKRKAAQASKGVEKLKKANTKGMAKLSSFFQKAETKVKA